MFLKDTLTFDFVNRDFVYGFLLCLVIVLFAVFFTAKVTDKAVLFNLFEKTAVVEQCVKTP